MNHKYVCEECGGSNLTSIAVIETNSKKFVNYANNRDDECLDCGTWVNIINVIDHCSNIKYVFGDLDRGYYSGNSLGR